MLKFPCICGKNFAVENDRAGSDFQCPDCGRLITVPTLNELESFSTDGTYKVDSAPATDEPGRAAELHGTFARQRADETGQQIDMRPTMDEWMRVGDDPTGAPPQVPAIKYDPETGELVQPLEFKDEPPRSAEPVSAEPVAAIPLAKPVLSYARVRKNKSGTMNPAQILLQLLMPQNAVVIFFIVIFHILVITVMALAMRGLFIIAPVIIVCFFVIIGHYALVLEETSVEEKDELPSPMRSVSFGEDIWRPFLVTGLAVIYSYWPAALASILVPDPYRTAVGLAFFLLGSIVFPASLMTTTTSDIVANLSPDRLLRVISVSGAAYWAATGATLTGIVLYAFGLTSSTIATCTLFGGRAFVPMFLKSYLFGLPGLVFGIYLLHFASWYLGLIWREHHEEFNWVGQRPERMKPQQRRASVEVSRAEAQRQRELRDAARREGRRM